MSLKMYFNNKVILIVGASTGIGRAVALKLAAAGAKLIITARSQDKLDSLENEILNNGGQCLAIAADALIEQEAAAVVRAGVERFGRLDIALLNVGGAQIGRASCREGGDWSSDVCSSDLKTGRSRSQADYYRPQPRQAR